MNLQAEQIGALHYSVRITIDPADYSEPFEKSIKEYGRKVQMPGFRVGHVPTGLIKKMYGDSVLAEELNKMVNEQMGNYLKENNFELFGDALASSEERLELDYRESRSYVFAYEIGVQPEISLTSHIGAGKVFTRYRIPAKEDEIAQETERLLKKYGKREDVGNVEENDVVYAHAHELTQEGTIKENGIHADTYFNTQMLNEDRKDLFLGSSQGDVKNIDDIFSVFKGDKVKVAKNILHQNDATEESVAAISPRFEFKIDRIVRLQPAVMDEDFFKAVSAELGEISTEEDVRTKIADNIQTFNNSMTEVTVENEIYKYLGETTNIPLPEVFLRKWFERTNEKDPDKTDLDKEFDLFKSQLKQSLIYKKIQKEHDIQATKEEVIREAVLAVQMSYGQLGEDFVRYVVESQLKEKEFVEQMRDRVMQKKFFDAIKGYVQIEEKSVTLEEYQQLTKKEEVYAE